MVVICKDEIAKLRKLDDSGSRDVARGAQQRGGINAAVADDVNGVFKGKTVSLIRINLIFNGEWILSVIDSK